MSTTIISSTSFSLKIFTALIGSPTYFGLPNLTVLTRPPFLTNRQGVIRGRNMFTSPQNCSAVGSPTGGFFPGETARHKCFLRERTMQRDHRSPLLQESFSDLLARNRRNAERRICLSLRYP